MKTAHIICGSPGSGKSTFGLKLAKELNAALLDIDTVTERLVRLSLGLLDRDPNDRDSPFFKTHFRNPIYEAMFDIAKENLEVMDVVVVGPFTKEIRNRAWPTELAKRLQSNIKIYYTRCSPAERRLRVQRRANLRDASKLQDWDANAAYYGAETPPLFPHKLVDTDG